MTTEPTAPGEDSGTAARTGSADPAESRSDSLAAPLDSSFADGIDDGIGRGPNLDDIESPRGGGETSPSPELSHGVDENLRDDIEDRIADGADGGLSPAGPHRSPDASAAEPSPYAPTSGPTAGPPDGPSRRPSPYALGDDGSSGFGDAGSTSAGGIDDRAGTGPDAGMVDGGAGKTAARAARAGGGKAADALGASVGAKKAGQFVRRSESDGSLRGDLKEISEGAKEGNKIGAAFGGVGAPVGAALGAAVQAAKTKSGRRAILLGVGAPIIVPVVILAFLLGLTTFTAGSVTGANETQDEGDTIETMAVDGIELDVQNIYRTAGSYGDVPPEVLAAMVYVRGDEPSAEDAEPMDAEEAEAAIEDNEPVGPFGILPQEAQEAAQKYDVDFDVAVLNDLEASSTFVSGLLHALLVEARDSRPNPAEIQSFDLSTGVVISENPDAAPGEGTQMRYLTGEDPSGNGLALEGSNFENGDDHAALREVFLEALGKMTVDAAEENAEETFNTAMMWHLGRSLACGGGMAETVTGAWANPLLGTVTSPYGMRVHPITGEYKLHDGTDISPASGEKVHAAGDGTVTVLNESWSGTNNLVTIDHGDGTVTKYGHMAEALVKTGDEVKAGDEIGVPGSEGSSTGVHLHFMVEQDGETTDPFKFMKDKGVTLGKDDPNKPVGGSGGGGGGSGGVYDQIGEIPQIDGPVGEVRGNLVVASANIKTRSGVTSSLRTITGTADPDFITVNEIGDTPLSQMNSAARGYSAYRYPKVDKAPDGGTRSMDNAILYDSSKWKMMDGGRIKIAEDDLVIFQGSKKRWGRWAAWGLFQSTSGDVVSVISTHHMTNPTVTRRHWGNYAWKNRAAQYANGMEILIDFVEALEAHGPVVMGGDMNSHPNDGDWAAAPKMAAAGYAYTKDQGVMYDFFAEGTRASSRQVGIASDHPALITKLSGLGGAGSGSATSLPKSWTGTSSTGEAVTLDRKQLEFAVQIYQQGQEMSVSDDGVVIAFMTVFTESKFANYASDVYPETIGHEYPKGAIGSDHDSVGLFQQRPESGWGEPMQLLDVPYEASAFFGGPEGPNKGSPMGLLDHTGWESRPKGEVAQDVQVSAYPDRYAAWEDPSFELLELVKNASVSEETCAGADPEAPIISGNCEPQPNNPISDAGVYTPFAIDISNCMYGMFGEYIATIGGYRTSSISGNHERGCALDIMIKDYTTPTGVLGGDTIAAWLMENREKMGVQYVMWRQRIWSVDRFDEGWRPFEDRGSPTANHFDHVHVSVYGPQCLDE